MTKAKPKPKAKAKAKPKAKARTKATPQPVAPDQLKAVLKWILQANDEIDVKEAIKKHYPDANETELIVAAVEEISEIGKEEPDFTRGWALGATRDLVRKMIEIGDFSNAMRGIKQVHDLAGD